MQKYRINYTDGLTAAELIYSRQKAAYGLGKMV